MNTASSLYQNTEMPSFRMNGCVPGLALIERLRAPREWVIKAASDILFT